MTYDKENLFAKIIRKEIPSDPVFENDLVLAFADISPQAPVHVLIIPKADIATTNEITTEHDKYLGAMFAAARQIASDKGLAEDGYRLVINCQEGAGQTVFHLHMHLLGGRSLQWPPG